MMLTKEQILELERSDDPDAQLMGQRTREGLVYRAQREQEMREAGDWDDLIGFADSHHRAAVLVEALGHCTSKAARTHLLREWFNACDALAPQREQLRAHLGQTDFFTDEAGAATPLQLPVTVYRGAWHDDEVEAALSWTTDLTFAERFCCSLVGPRARYVLGIYREDATPTVFRATCLEAYAFLNSRGESEVVAKRLTAIEAISELVIAHG